MFLQIFIYCVVFLFGLIVGSFLNCIIYRLKTDESFLKGRSFCPHCKHILSWQDLIPIFSFLILKGRCRYCQNKISWQYPLVELSTAFLFLLVLIFQQPLLGNFSFLNFFHLIYYWIIFSFLIIIFVYDLKHYIIPDKVIYPAIGISLIFNFQFLLSKQFLVFKNSLLSALGAAVFFLLIVLISKGKWMGVGDIKLAFLMGLILGWPNILVALFSSFFLGAIIGLGLIIAGKKTMKSEVPFGPFLVTGTLLAIFFGEKIINCYLTIFFDVLTLI